MTYFLIVSQLLLLGFSYSWGSNKAKRLALSHTIRPKSQPHHHGLYVLISGLIPAFVFLSIVSSFERPITNYFIWNKLPIEFRTSHLDSRNILYTKIENFSVGAISSESIGSEILSAAELLNNIKSITPFYKYLTSFLLMSLGVFYGVKKINVSFKAREKLEKLLKLFLMFSAFIAIFTTLGIFLSLIFETVRFFKFIPVSDFIFGLNWQPQIAIRADQVASEGAFGIVPLLFGTGLICLIAMLVAAPLGLMSAIYLSEYASLRFRSYAKPLLEILAGIPTVVYGFFASLVVGPLVKNFALGLGLEVGSESALAAGSVMGIMIIPFISSLSDDVINAVPQTLRDASYALGATKSETIRKVVFPAALPGIIGSLLLAVSRAIGETMIVVMAAGLIAKITINPLESVTTATVQIVTTLVGDQEFNSPKTLSAFALGLFLFLTTLFLNFVSYRVVQKYKEQYE